MAAIISNLLTKEQVSAINAKLFSTPFADGNMSGGVLGRELKKNTQVPPNSPHYRELAELVMGAMQKNDAFNTAAIPRRILSPIFSAYAKGDEYKQHVDAAMMGPYPGMRTDLSITIFLNDPSAYNGGELVLESPFGENVFKLPPGSAILYPTHFVHRVNKVTKGRRIAAVTWVESMVSDPHKREILNDLGSAMTQLISQKGDMKVIRDLEKGRLNLLRMWATT